MKPSESLKGCPTITKGWHGLSLIYMEKKGPEQKSHRLLEPPWAPCQLFIHFLANRSEPSSTRETLKAGSARSNLVRRVLSRTQGTRLSWNVTYLIGSFFCDGRVILLAGPIFLHINTLARPARPTGSRRENICTLFECQCIQHESTDWGHHFYVSCWRRDCHFTWSSEPREGPAACSAKRVPSFLRYFKTLSIGRGFENRTRDLPLCSHTLYRLSY